MRISETEGYMKLVNGLSNGAATVGRPTGVNGKKVSPRRARVTSKEVDHIKTRAMKGCETDSLVKVKAGGPGSGRHPNAGQHVFFEKHEKDKALSHLKERREAGESVGLFKQPGQWISHAGFGAPKSGGSKTPSKYFVGPK